MKKLPKRREDFTTCPNSVMKMIAARDTYRLLCDDKKKGIKTAKMRVGENIVDVSVDLFLSNYKVGDSVDDVLIKIGVIPAMDVIDHSLVETYF